MVFETLKEQFVAFSDSQRLERLKECQDLQILLNACTKRRQQDPTTPTPASALQHQLVADLEDVPAGFKMMRYFEWRTKELVRVQDTDGSTHVLAMPSTTEQQQQQHMMTCAREAHALWACRAVTLACAPDLNQLKQCFDQEGKMAVLSHSETAYDGNTNSNTNTNSTTANLPCLAQQQRMGSCVAVRASELQERVKVRQETDAKKASEDV